jgi:carbon-monoxide dehydrogenase small subunit
MKQAIAMSVNGESWDLEVESSDTLLEVLRTRIGVKSPKIGCERGECGTCTVLLDGKSVRSCLVLAVEVDGHEVTTVEGLCREGPTALQRSLVAHNSFQCGFCAPGMVLSVAELLSRNPRPEKDDIQEALSGNLCRCTGYESIIAAVLDLETESSE